jgi:hypothetical protein
VTDHSDSSALHLHDDQGSHRPTLSLPSLIRLPASTAKAAANQRSRNGSKLGARTPEKRSNDRFRISHSNDAANKARAAT